MLRLANTEGVNILEIAGNQFELCINQKVFNEPFKLFAGLVDGLPHFYDFLRLERGGIEGQYFAIGQNSVERRAHFMRQHEADVVAQAAQANRSQDLSFELSDVPVPISGEYLTKIVDELVQNAFKFSEAGAPVRVKLSETSSAIALSVSDQGRGFSNGQIAHIGAYMQFDRKMHEQQGQGLGLTIVKRLVELHGGTFSIESTKDAGSTVTAKLPKAKAE